MMINKKRLSRLWSAGVVMAFAGLTMFMFFMYIRRPHAVTITGTLLGCLITWIAFVIMREEK